MRGFVEGGDGVLHALRTSPGASPYWTRRVRTTLRLIPSMRAVFIWLYPEKRYALVNTASSISSWR